VDYGLSTVDLTYNTENDMPKLKTNRSAKKRIRISKKGKVKYFRAGRGHLLTSKSGKRKRHLGRAGYIRGDEASMIRNILPYGA